MSLTLGHFAWVARLLPAGLVCSFLSLAILAFSGIRRLAPSLLASAIRYDSIRNKLWQNVFAMRSTPL